MTEKIICPLGQYDIPIVQMQPEFRVDLLKSNVAVFGSSMSGKTTFLKLLINSLHRQLDETEEQIFILDFSGGLMEYKELPLVAAYFDNSNEEYVKRVFKILETILKENVKQLGSDSFSMCHGKQPIHTTFIVDNLNSFVDEARYTAYHEKFGRLCREGRSRGISIVFTATDTKGITRYLLSFEQKAALNLPSDKYSEIFGEKADSIGNIAGRGYANVTERPEGIIGTFSMNSPYEFQCYKPADLKSEPCRFLELLNKKFGYSPSSTSTEPYKKHAKRYMTFPQELTADEYEKLKQPFEAGDKKYSDEAVSVGLDYVDFKPVSIEPKDSRVIAIYGKKEFGKTNLLTLLLEKLLRDKPQARFVFFDDGRKQLKDLYENAVDSGVQCILFDEFRSVTIPLADGSETVRKLSPMMQFYRFIHEEVSTLGDFYGPYERVLEQVYGDSNRDNIPEGCDSGSGVPTVFVIQSKSVYLNSKVNSDFIHYLLPELLDSAEDNDYLFIFSDVRKITEADVNSVFNSTLKTVFLLDNIAEFAGERGSKSVFGDMDVKALKEDYARCELGDGYFYDVEGDNLKKMKFIFNNK